MSKIIYIMFGGALGASARYLFSTWIHSLLGVTFPWGTLSVNLIGSFLMGILWGILQAFSLPENIRVFAMVGFLGSFTTFSTFSFENLELMRNNEHGLAILNMIVSVVGGLLMAYLGFLIANHFFSLTD